VGLDGRIVVVTGVAQGIGRAMALSAAQAGTEGLLLTDRQPDPGVVPELTAHGAACEYFV
jgi:NAD(P)-dependent dehydrogenase (short-subunit alcohol dehydrogenase family)